MQHHSQQRKHRIIVARHPGNLWHLKEVRTKIPAGKFFVSLCVVLFCFTPGISRVTRTKQRFSNSAIVRDEVRWEFVSIKKKEKKERHFWITGGKRRTQTWLTAKWRVFCQFPHNSQSHQHIIAVGIGLATKCSDNIRSRYTSHSTLQPQTKLHPYDQEEILVLKGYWSAF